MAISKNPKIQDLMNQVEDLDPADTSIEAKLAEIAGLVKAEQQKMSALVTGSTFTPAIAGDPADEFACEGCQ